MSSNSAMLRKQSTSGERELFRTVDQLKEENEELQRQIDEVKSQLAVTDEAMRKNGEMMSYLNVKVNDNERDGRAYATDSAYGQDREGPRRPRSQSGASHTSSKSIRSVYEKMKNFSFTKYVKAIAVAQMLICMFNSFARPDFFASCVLIALYAAHEKDKKAMLAYFITSFISITVDVTWLGLSNTMTSLRKESAEMNVEIIAFATTTLGLLFKVMLLYPTWKAYKELPTVKPSEQGKGAVGDDGKTPRARSRVRRLSCFGLMNPNATGAEKATVLISLLMLVFSLYAAILRPDAASIVAVLGLYAINERDRGAASKFLILLALAFIFDIVWIAIHADVDVGGARTDGVDTSQIENVERFVNGLTIIGMIFKALLLPPTFIVWKSLPKIKPEDRNRDVEMARPTPSAAAGEGRKSRLLSKASNVVQYDRSKFFKALAVLCVIELILVLTSTIARGDLMAVVLIIAYYAMNEKDKKSMHAFTFFTACTIVPDFVYLIEKAHSSGHMSNLFGSGALAFVYALTVISLILKIILIFVGYRLAQDLPVKKQGEDDEEESECEQWKKAMAGVLLMQLFFVFIACIGDYTDPFGFVCIVALYAINEEDRAGLLTYVIFMDISVILDVIHLAVHFDEANAAMEEKKLTNVHFGLGMAVIGLIGKFVAHYPLFKLFSVLPDDDMPIASGPGGTPAGLPTYPSNPASASKAAPVMSYEDTVDDHEEPYETYNAPPREEFREIQI